MTKIRLPKHLQTDTLPDIEVPIDLTVTRKFDPAEVNALQGKLGLIPISGEQLGAVAEIGSAAKALGIVNLIHGGVAITSNTLLELIGVARKIVLDDSKKDKVKLDATRVIGYLAGQLARVNSSSTKVEQARAEVVLMRDRQQRNSFAPGVAITVQSEVREVKPA